MLLPHHTRLCELQRLDSQIDATAGENFERLEVLMEERTRCCALLAKGLPEDADRLAVLRAMEDSTKALKDRFAFLRNNSAEDLGLLQRQDQLLRLLSPKETDPAYMDYSA